MSTTDPVSGSRERAPAELVDIVDDQDRVLYVTTRANMRANVLLHRSVFILCQDSRDRVYVHRRTATKDLFPSYYDMFVGGVVSAGESYEQAALREVHEELGIHGVPVVRRFHHRYEGPSTRAHIEVFETIWDEPIVQQASEVAWGAFVSWDELEANREGWQYVPDGQEIFDCYFRRSGRDRRP